MNHGNTTISSNKNFTGLLKSNKNVSGTTATNFFSKMPKRRKSS